MDKYSEDNPDQIMKGLSLSKKNYRVVLYS